MLFSVPGARSSLDFPATVTGPGFEGCLNCLWLPRVATRTHPSSFSIRSTSPTFIESEYQLATPHTKTQTAMRHYGIVDATRRSYGYSPEALTKSQHGTDIQKHQIYVGARRNSHGMAALSMVKRRYSGSGNAKACAMNVRIGPTCVTTATALPA